MKKKSLGKLLTLIACVLALVVAGIAGTYAYLIDDDEVVNTFTVGDVQISLDETDVDGDNNTKENAYHLIPGETYLKDPTVTVLENSEESYVRILMTLKNAADLKAIMADKNLELDDFITDLNADWVLKGVKEDTANDALVYEYRYKTTVSGMSGEVELPALFETLAVPGVLDSDDLKALYGTNGEFEMIFKAHAIQASGFENAEDAAWAAFDAQIA